MAFNKPTVKEISERIKSDIEAELGIGSALRRSLVWAFSYALGGAVYLLHVHLVFIADQILPDTMSSSFLHRFASIWGVIPKLATPTERDILITGIDGAVIETGTIWKDDNDHVFKTEAEVTIAGGQVVAHVVAEEYGAKDDEGNSLNIAVGSKLSLQSPISGVDSEATIEATGNIDGQDKESDEDLLGRVLERMQKPPAGGKKSDYTQWAKEVAGVTRAWTYPARMGLGTVGVSFVTDNDASIIPTAAKVQEVQDYIDEQRPITSEVTVFAPVESQVDFTIQLNPNTLEVQTAVENALKDLFSRESEPEGRIYISHVREAISTSLGEEDHVLVSPNADIEAAAGEIKTLGAITFQNLVY